MMAEQPREVKGERSERNVKKAVVLVVSPTIAGSSKTTAIRDSLHAGRGCGYTIEDVVWAMQRALARYSPIKGVGAFPVSNRAALVRGSSRVVSCALAWGYRSLQGARSLVF